MIFVHICKFYLCKFLRTKKLYLGCGRKKKEAQKMKSHENLLQDKYSKELGNIDFSVPKKYSKTVTSTCKVLFIKSTLN